MQYIVRGYSGAGRTGRAANAPVDNRGRLVLDSWFLLITTQALTAEHSTLAQKAASELSLWTRCLRVLEGELSEQQFNTWIRPLQAIENSDGLRLLAPNHFVVDWVTRHCVEKIEQCCNGVSVVLEVGSREILVAQPSDEIEQGPSRSTMNSRLNPVYTFENFV